VDLLMIPERQIAGIPSQRLQPSLQQRAEEARRLSRCRQGWAGNTKDRWSALSNQQVTNRRKREHRHIVYMCPAYRQKLRRRAAIRAPTAWSAEPEVLNGTKAQPVSQLAELFLVSLRCARAAASCHQHTPAGHRAARVLLGPERHCQLNAVLPGVLLDGQTALAETQNNIQHALLSKPGGVLLFAALVPLAALAMALECTSMRMPKQAAVVAAAIVAAPPARPPLRA
jgi:hypothetical protein